MGLKKYLGEIGAYFGTGLSLKDHPEWAFATIIAILIINKLYHYMMRNHRLLSDEYIDENGNPRKTTYTDKR